MAERGEFHVSKSRSFSIYLLKQGYDASNALKDDHQLDGAIAADHLPEGASLFVLDSHPREPWWKGYFGVQKDLNQVTKGALIFLELAERCFALSFGHVYHNLKDESYEYDFGLRVTLNSVDPIKLKSTDILEPGAARRQRTQIPIESDLTFFDFDRDSAILKSLTGKVKDEHEDLFKHATGSSNLRISSALSPENLIGLCEKLLELYESNAYRDTFPDIQNITPVRDPQTIEELNLRLLEALRAKSDDLYLAIPAIINYADNVCIVFSGEGQSLIYDDVFLGRYYEYLEVHGIDLNAIGIAELKKHRLVLTDENGAPRESYPLLKCLIYDTSLGVAEEAYHLNEGDWYKVDESYVARLRTFLDSRYNDLDLPDFSHANEGAYNEGVAKNNPAYLCFDKTNIAPPRQTMVEPCDLYSVKEGNSVFHHIKISTLSAELSHLFNQGANAIQLLKLEPQSVEKLNALIDGKASDAAKDGFKAPVNDGKFHVIFGIISHKDKAAKSDNLPLFSRISLMRVMRDLQTMSVKARYGFITDASPKKAGKKKKRKKKSDAGADS